MVKLAYIYLSIVDKFDLYHSFLYDICMETSYFPSYHLHIYILKLNIFINTASFTWKLSTIYISSAFFWKLLKTLWFWGKIPWYFSIKCPHKRKASLPWSRHIWPLQLLAFDVLEGFELEFKKVCCLPGKRSLGLEYISKYIKLSFYIILWSSSFQSFMFQYKTIISKYMLAFWKYLGTFLILLSLFKWDQTEPYYNTLPCICLFAFLVQHRSGKIVGKLWNFRKVEQTFDDVNVFKYDYV